MPRGTLNAGLTGRTATYSFGKITTIKTTQPAFKVQPGTANANILVVAGGGGGAPGGGGGAGGFLQHPNSPVSASSSYTVTVGAGSTSTSRNTGNAGNSQFGTLTASVGGGQGGDQGPHYNNSGTSG